MSQNHNQKTSKKHLRSKPVHKDELGELHNAERELIWYIRHNFRYGEVTIKTRDGLPVDIIKTVERYRLQ